MSKQLKKSNKAIVGRVKTILLPHKYMPAQTSSFSEIDHKTYSPVAFFTKIITIKNSLKCETKIKKSFTKILTKILIVKMVLTLRVKLPCRKCTILIVREIFVLSFIVSEKKYKKRWTMHWRSDLKIKKQFIVSAFSLA